MIAEPSDEVAVKIFADVLALIAVWDVVMADAILEEALWRLAKVESDPTSRVASESLRVAYAQTSAAVIAVEVSVRVPFVHTSAANVPNVVSERLVAAQTAVGMVEAREVEAVKILALVLLFTSATILVEAARILVLAVVAADCAPLAADCAAKTPAPSELDAARTVEFVLVTFVLTAVTAEPILVLAVKIDALVLALTAEVIPLVCVLVFAFTTAAILVEAESTVALVLALIAV